MLIAESDIGFHACQPGVSFSVDYATGHSSVHHAERRHSPVTQISALSSHSLSPR